MPFWTGTLFSGRLTIRTSAHSAATRPQQDRDADITVNCHPSSVGCGSALCFGMRVQSKRLPDDFDQERVDRGAQFLAPLIAQPSCPNEKAPLRTYEAHGLKDLPPAYVLLGFMAR